MDLEKELFSNVRQIMLRNRATRLAVLLAQSDVQQRSTAAMEFRMRQQEDDFLKETNQDPLPKDEFSMLYPEQPPLPKLKFKKRRNK